MGTVCTTRFPEDCDKNAFKLVIEALKYYMSEGGATVPVVKCYVQAQLCPPIEDRCLMVFVRTALKRSVCLGFAKYVTGRYIIASAPSAQPPVPCILPIPCPPPCPTVRCVPCPPPCCPPPPPCPPPCPKAPARCPKPCPPPPCPAACPPPCPPPCPPKCPKPCPPPCKPTCPKPCPKKKCQLASRPGVWSKKGSRKPSKYCDEVPHSPKKSKSSSNLPEDLKM